MAVEMADRVSSRRGTANSFFLAVHAAVTTAVAAMLDSNAGPFGPGLVASAGLALSAAWWLALRSYRDLNAAKYQVITQIEERLPVTVFHDEWLLLKRDPVPGWRGRYAELGQVERLVPFVFGALYLLALVRLILGW